MLKVKRYFLEIDPLIFNNKKIDLPVDIQITLDKKKDFNINKFFYKQIGVDHYWRDRLIWSDKEWIKYISNINFETWIIKKKDNLIGFYEQEFHPDLNEVELINMGILKEYRGEKYGSILLKHSIKNAIKFKPNRAWVHTCSLDHEFALHNYKSKGFKIFKEEEIDFVD
jgi:GNAT superfamily N-acetyltransferase